MLIAAIALSLAAGAPTDADKAAISEAVGRHLKDGESARYLWPEMKEGDAGAYCALVNAKNSHGAYTGFVPVRVLGAHAGGSYRVFDVMLGEGADAPIVAKLCADDGFDLDPARI